MSPPASPESTRSPILWGAYLACSWTWCIGLFLPALLLRDMGWPGFWVFAIPNVVGAAAMGWILTSRADSARQVENHPQAIWWFSAITLAFHLFWILWIANFILAAFHLSLSWLAGCLGAVFAFALVSNRFIKHGDAPKAALALLAFSLTVLIATAFTSDPRGANTVLLSSAQGSADSLWMLPVMLFGFLFCPYLDITFHHARQQLDTQKKGRLGFTIGFIGFFFFMILLTTRYSGVIAGAMDGTGFTPINTPWLAAGILIHILCQWFFTVRVHLDRIGSLPGTESKRSTLLLLALFSGGLGYLAPRIPSFAGLTGGEIVYRLFMSAYGLIFPAYVLCRIITRSARKSILWLTVVSASPMFWAGFIERQPIWLLPGMGIMILGALFQRPKRNER